MSQWLIGFLIAAIVIRGEILLIVILLFWGSEP